MKILLLLLTAAIPACSTLQPVKSKVVRTTAYCHKEADSLKYGRKNAVGTNLLYYGKVRSSAADWTIYPLGTEFKIKGIPNSFIIDDYGSALVGTKTIDLYFPTKKLMNRWGARNVEIEIIKWGSYSKSRNILINRTKFPHVRRMVAGIDKAIAKS